MVFSSFVFLMCFLPLTLAVYYLVRGVKARNLVLCLFSLVFYAWGEPVYILLMLGSIFVNYLSGLALERVEAPAGRKAILIATLIVDLGAIALFKYGNFVLGSVSSLLHVQVPVLKFALPIGISFYTFQILSYVIDVYRGNTKTQHSLLALATYIALFPQLVAGPIVRYETVETELRERRETMEDFIAGIRRFITGLGKKVLIANAMARMADSVFDAAELPCGAILWLGAIAYMLQIYFDFSGYSDMAIGMGRMFGFHFLENFDHPYIARSITDFWRRWHMSLSGWFRDYVYIPLGGSRVSIPRNILNLLIVWMLTGLWHGASWNFVLWGLYYGVLLIVEKFVLGKRIEKIPNALRHLFTLFFVLIGWVIFRVEDLSALGKVFSGMAGFSFAGAGTYLIGHANILEPMYMLIPALVGCVPLSAKLRQNCGQKRWYGWVSGACLILVYYLSVCSLLASTYNPFIYFRF